MIAGTMRRLLRWTFNTLAAASLLLCVATTVLWVRSHWVFDEFIAERPLAFEVGRKFGTPKHLLLVWSYRGKFELSFFRSDLSGSQATPPWQFEFRTATGEAAEFLGGTLTEFGLHQYRKGVYTQQDCGLPHWSLVSAFAVLPAIFAFRQVRAVRRRRRRSRLGLCPACGYDLRATPERCPECGRQGDKARGKGAVTGYLLLVTRRAFPIGSRTRVTSIQ
jgi:hypothetical protein